MDTLLHAMVQLVHTPPSTMDAVARMHGLSHSLLQSYANLLDVDRQEAAQWAEHSLRRLSADSLDYSPHGRRVAANILASMLHATSVSRV